MLPLVVINLPQRKDRKERLIRHIHELQHNLKTFHKIHIMDAVSLPATPGIGCMLSHQRALKLAEENQWESVMVVEDDVVFPEDFDERWQTLSTQLPESWGILFGGVTTARNVEKYSQHLFRFKEGGLLTATHCMVYHRSAYKSLIQLIDMESMNPLPNHMDLLLCMNFSPQHIYVACPFLGYFEKQGTSDVRKGKDISNDYLQLKETEYFLEQIHAK